MSPAKPANLLKCRKCATREDETTRTVGPRATGAGNKRVRDGVSRNAWHIRCQTCGHEWWSVTSRARMLSKAADEEATQARRDRRR